MNSSWKWKHCAFPSDTYIRSRYGNLALLTHATNSVPRVRFLHEAFRTHLMAHNVCEDRNLSALGSMQLSATVRYRYERQFNMPTMCGFIVSHCGVKFCARIWRNSVSTLNLRELDSCPTWRCVLRVFANALYLLIAQRFMDGMLL